MSHSHPTNGPDEQDEQTEALLAAYVDGEATPAERAAVERVVVDDPATARALAQMRRARELVGGLPVERPPAGLADVAALAELSGGTGERAALLGPAGAASGGPGRDGRAWWPMAAAAGVVLLLAGALVAAVVLGLPENTRDATADADPPADADATRRAVDPAPVARPEPPAPVTSLPPQIVEPPVERPNAEPPAPEPPTMPNPLAVPLAAAPEPVPDTPMIAVEANDPAALREAVASHLAAAGVWGIDLPTDRDAVVALTTDQARDLVAFLDARPKVASVDVRGLAPAGPPLRAGDRLRLRLLLPEADGPADVAARVRDDGTLQFAADSAAGAALAGAEPLAATGQPPGVVRRQVEQLARRRLPEGTRVQIEPAEPEIRPGDALEITLRGTAGPFEAGPDGRVTLPALGAVQAYGLTPGQLADVIAFRYEAEFEGAEPEVAVRHLGRAAPPTTAPATVPATRPDALLPVTIRIGPHATR